jgi:hypothetical protein
MISIAARKTAGPLQGLLHVFACSCMSCFTIPLAVRYHEHPRAGRLHRLAASSSAVPAPKEGPNDAAKELVVVKLLARKS